MGFDVNGDIVNRPDSHGSQALDWADICQRSAKVNHLFTLLNEYYFFLFFFAGLNIYRSGWTWYDLSDSITYKNLRLFLF